MLDTCTEAKIAEEYGKSPDKEPWQPFKAFFGEGIFPQRQCIQVCRARDYWHEGLHYRVIDGALEVRPHAMGYAIDPTPVSGSTLDLSGKTTALYRHYDADGSLLYVGISLNPIRRLQQHAESDWFDQITRIEIERFSTRAEALAAERKAIKSERPFFNEKHNLAGGDNEVEG